jgi:hypothetical protein
VGNLFKTIRPALFQSSHKLFESWPTNYYNSTIQFMLSFLSKRLGGWYSLGLWRNGVYPKIQTPTQPNIIGYTARQLPVSFAGDHLKVHSSCNKNGLKTCEQTKRYIRGAFAPTLTYFRKYLIPWS